MIKSVLLYERVPLATGPDDCTPWQVRLTLENGEVMGSIRAVDFEVTDEYKTDPEADPMKILVELSEDGRRIVRLSGSQSAYDEFWNHIWPPHEDTSLLE